MTPSSAQAFFDRLFVDFQATQGGFRRLLQAIENGEIFNISTDGSKIDSDEASAGWLFWIVLQEDDDDYDAEEDTDKTNGRRRILLANTILVDGRLQSNTSYRAEGTGKLAAVIVLQCLYAFLGRTPTKPTYHTCDNQALVSRVNTIRKYNDFKTLNDPIDGDIIVPTAYWATATKLESKWVRGHAERRKVDISEWTDEEWANDLADSYANRAWTTPSRPHCSPIATNFLHHNSLQILIPGGTISGKIARRIADDINKRQGLQQLQKVHHLDDETFGMIDWESYSTASKSFTKTIYSRAHLAKQTGGQWFTEARAHKYDNHASNLCRCCDHGTPETTTHVFQCSTRDPVHRKYTKKFIELMKEKELPNDILMMFETGIDLVLDPPPRPFHFDDLMEEEAIRDDDRVLKILNDTTI